MTSSESNYSNAFQGDGIHLRIFEPNFIVLSIPENCPNSSTFVEICVYLINNTPNPLRLNSNETLITELLTSDGQVLQGEAAPDELTYRVQRNVGFQQSFRFRLSQFISGLVHWFFRIPKREFYPRLVESGRGIPVTLILKLFWQNNLLRFQVNNSPSYSPIISSLLEESWSFEALQLGTYQLRFVWNSVSSNNESGSDIEITEGISSGQLATQFVNLRLVEPVGDDNSTVEVDGIHFETLVPERMLNLPDKKHRIEIPVQLGIRITNNTSNPVRFNFFNTLIPQLIGVDGQAHLRRYFRRGTKRPLESDFPLVMPGENVTFFPYTSLSWKKCDQFTLNIAFGDGGFWNFEYLKAGIYGIHFMYKNKDPEVEIYDRESMNTNLIEDIWMGIVSMPKVEFCLGKF